MAKDCEVCGTEFEAKRSNAKYCSPQCRLRAHRGAKSGSVSLVNAVRKDLESAGALDSYSGQLALQLAKQMATPGATNLPSLSKELRVVMAQAVGPAEPAPAPAAEEVAQEPDIVDEVRRKREQRQASAAATG